MSQENNFWVRLVTGWKTNWKSQIPGAFVLAMALLIVMKKITGTEFALIITAFVPYYSKLFKSKINNQNQNQSK
jgi:hypothetical protein